MSPALSTSKILLNLYTFRKRCNLEEAFDNPEKAQSFVKSKLDQAKTENILFYETTSGSTGAKKNIPYTKSLINSFSNMFAYWAWDILNHAPIELNKGVIYMSISPKTKKELESKDDRQYINTLIRPLVSRFLAVDPNSLYLDDANLFMSQLAQKLLKRKDLEIISIWSPSYFLSLMNYIESHADRFDFNGDWSKVWPNLKMISAWDSSQAKQPAEQLKRKFPQAWFQGKGLLATEGPMTMPWIRAQGNVPLLTEAYFEFIDNNQNRKKLHQLKEGEVYEILPSFLNGLVDYRIGDFVQVTHFYRRTPCFEFVGRGAETSDLVGEKLSGMLVRELFQNLNLDFFTLIPKKNHYLLLWDGLGPIEPNDFENCLKTSYHYHLARQLEQLNPLEVKKAPGLLQQYRNLALKKNMKLGDLKEQNIITESSLAYDLEKWAAAISV